MTSRFEYHGWSLAHDAMLLRSSAGETQAPPTALLVAIDDTGDPSTNDPTHPVFGLAGCAILVGQYMDVVRGPWARMKEAHFGGARRPLHASDLRPGSAEQHSALNTFFGDSVFFRFAALITRQLAVRESRARIELATLVLLGLLTNVAHRVPFSHLFLMFDPSDRLLPELSRVLKNLRATQSIAGVPRDIPIDFSETPKALCEPLLEVADFVAHTGGRAAKRSLAGVPFQDNPDFRAVFPATPPGLAEFLLVTEVAPLPGEQPGTSVTG